MKKTYIVIAIVTVIILGIGTSTIQATRSNTVMEEKKHTFDFGECSIWAYGYQACIRADYIIEQNDWIACAILNNDKNFVQICGEPPK